MYLQDARSDIYSLGAVAYFLLAGRTVFECKSIIDACMSHSSEQPVPPSEKRGEPIASDLEKLVLQCLEKDPDQRPESMRELQKALSSCSAANAWTEEMAAAWWRKEFPTKSGKKDAAGDAPDMKGDTIDL